MEPLLGGRLSNVPSTIVARLKQREPEMSVASWAFRFAGSLPGVQTVLSGMTRMEHLQDNLRTYAPLETADRKTISEFLQETAAQTDAALRHHPLQRLQILHAVSLRIGHSGHSAAL